MIIKLSPVRADGERLEAETTGEVLTVNGERFDFSPLAPGATLPAEAIGSPWFRGAVERDSAGELVITLTFPHGANAPEESRFPLPISVSADGPVNLPPADGEPFEFGVSPVPDFEPPSDIAVEPAPDLESGPYAINPEDEQP